MGSYKGRWRGFLWSALDNRLKICAFSYICLIFYHAAVVIGGSCFLLDIGGLQECPKLYMPLLKTWFNLNSVLVKGITTKFTLYADDTAVLCLDGFGVGEGFLIRFRCFPVWCLIKLLTDLLSFIYESQSRCHFTCRTEIVWFVFYSERYFASVAASIFNQTSKYVLPINK